MASESTDTARTHGEQRCPNFVHRGQHLVDARWSRLAKEALDALCQSISGRTVQVLFLDRALETRATRAPRRQVQKGGDAAATSETLAHF